MSWRAPDPELGHLIMLAYLGLMAYGFGLLIWEIWTAVR